MIGSQMRETPARTNWAGNVTFGAAEVHRPSSLPELQRLVAGRRRIRAAGTGHSFNLVADTEGDLVRLDGLPPRVELSADGRRATVGAGMRYSEAARALHAQGVALGSMASLPHISVAGACATGTHGSGDTRRSLAADVAALEIVGPDGARYSVDRDTDPDRLHGSVVALGALGVVTAVTLDVEPAFEVAQWVYTGLPLDRVADRFDEVFAAAYSVSVFTDWHSGTAQVWLKRRIDRESAGHPNRRWLGADLANEPQHPIPGVPPEYCTDQSGRPGPWYRRLPHYRPETTPSRGDELQSELLLPRVVAPRALSALRRLGGRMAPVLQISEIRTVAADELWLSPCRGRDTVALHFTWIPDTAAVLPVIAAIEAELEPLGGCPHWGKLTAMPPDALAARYPRMSDFRRLLLERDPEGKFRNAFVDRLLTRGTAPMDG